MCPYNSKIAREQNFNRRQQINEIERYAETLNTHLEAVKVRVPRQDQKAVNKIKARAKKLNLSRIVKAAIKDEKFTFWIEDRALDEAEKLDGLLALSTNVNDLDAETIIDHYKSRGDIESGFRTLKSEIQIAPVPTLDSQSNQCAWDDLLFSTSSPSRDSLKTSGTWYNT